MMADDMGWGDPSYNDGWVETPALDAMANAGLRFDRFYSASAVCSPTRGSCLTGRHPLRLGIPTANSGRLAANETPLSEVLDRVGYATGHFGKWHLGTLTTRRQDSNRGAPGNTAAYSPPWQHGYDYCFATEAKVPTFHPMRRTVNGLPEPTSFADPNFYGTYYWTAPPDPADWPTAPEGTPVDVTDNLSGDDSRAIMDRVIPFVREAVVGETPFFTVIWFHTPHKPLPDPEGSSGIDSADAYTDAIINMDTQIARLRSELDTLGVTENTMFWFCSDNGPENGVGRSGPFRERKRSLHEGGVRVPGILVWPEKIPAARVSDFPAVTSDYYPTILDYLCIDVPNQKPLDGISVRGVIEGTISAREQPIGFHFSNSRSWVSQQYKLISKNGGATFELYDLLADPSENRNIAAANPEVVQSMTGEFRAWQTAVETDTAYTPPDDTPTVVLATAQDQVAGAFTVDVTFSERVTGLAAEQFVITNGVVGELAGTGADYTVIVTPQTDGLVTVMLPAGSAQGSEGIPNLASNLLTVRNGDSDPPCPCGNIIIDDHFDDGTIDGWISQGNPRSATHDIGVSGSLIVSEVTPTQTNTNRGIASTVSFDPLGENGFTLTFVVESLSQVPAANGFFLGIVGDNSVFYRDGSTRNFGLTYFGTESRTNSSGGFGLNFGDNFGSAGAELRLAESDADLASFLDGFTATIQADSLQWSYEITGMNDPDGLAVVFEGRGAWTDAGTTFETLFDAAPSWHVVTSNQIAPAETHRVSFDRIRLVAGSEPPPKLLEARANAVVEPGEFAIRWASIEGRRYEIERSPDLIAWNSPQELIATERNTTFTDPGLAADGPRQFYRVRLLGPDT